MKLNIKLIERVLWMVFLVAIGWQTRVIVWQADRIFNEWRSVSVYATDILLIALFVCARYSSRWPLTSWASRYWIIGGVFCGALVAVSWTSLIPAMSFYYSARILQGIILFHYVRTYAWKSFSIHESLLAFVVGAVGQAILAITQWLLQRDVGIRWLGETLLRTNMHGVAVFVADSGEKILRAYGTFPHPNVLAFYLLVASWSIVWLWSRHGHYEHWSSWVWPVSYAILIVAMLVTWSRLVIVLWLGSVVAAVVFSRVRSVRRMFAADAAQRTILGVAYTSVVVLVCFGFTYWSYIESRVSLSRADEAITLRVFYVQQSIPKASEIFSRQRMIGIGLGNFTTWLAAQNPLLPAYYVAPVHNILLLIYVESGLLGIAIFFVSMAWVLRSAHHFWARRGLTTYGVGLLVGMMLIAAMNDHYFWTLQQGRLLWWMIAALAAGSAER